MLKNFMDAAPPGSVSARLARLATGEVLFDYHGERRVPAASTIKVAVMAELARRIVAGELRLSDRLPIPPEARLEDSVIGLLDQPDYTLSDLITMMIIVSDNTATNILIDLAGMDNVNRFSAGLGMKNTVLARKMLDFAAAKEGRENYTSASDLALLFGKIGRGELPLSDFMLKTLFRQKQGAFRRNLDPDLMKIAHKPGGLSTVAHDAGIFRLPQGDFVWCVMTSGIPNREGEELVGRSAPLLLEYVKTLR